MEENNVVGGERKTGVGVRKQRGWGGGRRTGVGGREQRGSGGRTTGVGEGRENNGGGGGGETETNRQTDRELE